MLLHFKLSCTNDIFLSVKESLRTIFVDTFSDIIESTVGILYLHAQLLQLSLVSIDIVSLGCLALHITSTEVAPVDILDKTCTLFSLFSNVVSHLEYFFNFDLFDVNRIFPSK